VVVLAVVVLAVIYSGLVTWSKFAFFECEFWISEFVECEFECEWGIHFISRNV